ELTNVGYYAFGKQLEQHAPGFFRANGFDATVQVAPSGSASVPSSPTPGMMPLKLEFTDGTFKAYSASPVKSVDLTLLAALFDESGKDVVWTGRFRTRLGHDTLGLLTGVKRVDQRYVEELLATVLTQMAKDQVVALKN